MAEAREIERKDSAAAATPSKPGVLALAIKDKTALYSAYMPFLEGSGLFIPTERPYQLGDEIFMLLQLPDSPAKLKIAGHVAWITPAAIVGRPKGVGVKLSAKGGGVEARNKIESILAGATKSSRPTHTM